jgi:hypothetical protein
MKKRFTQFGMVGLALVAVLAVGASPAMAKSKKKTVTRTATFSQCISVAAAVSETIPPAVAVIPVTVPNFKGGIQDGAVTAITSVGTRISHTFDGDLTINLISPGGRFIPLATRRGSSGAGYGTGATSCGGSLVNFSDLATTPIATPGNTPPAPITGTFKPEQPLSGVVGGPARGNWILLVSDQAGGDTGTLHAFSLNFTYSFKAQVKKKK